MLGTQQVLATLHQIEGFNYLVSGDLEHPKIWIFKLQVCIISSVLFHPISFYWPSMTAGHCIKMNDTGSTRRTEEYLLGLILNKSSCCHAWCLDAAGSVLGECEWQNEFSDSNCICLFWVTEMFIWIPAAHWVLAVTGSKCVAPLSLGFLM